MNKAQELAVARLYSLADILDRVPVSPKTLRDWYRRRLFPAPIVLGRRLFWQPEQLRDFLDAREREANLDISSGDGIRNGAMALLIVGFGLTHSPSPPTVRPSRDRL